MEFRTDLALERQEILNCGEEDGILVKKSKRKNVKITRISILNEKGAKKIGKPVGEYITIEVPDFAIDSEIMDDRLLAIQEAILSLLPRAEGTVLVAGLGNIDITPDALGPLTARRIFATRHIDNQLQKELGFSKLNSVSSVTFGVLGQTGIETVETIRGIAETISPCAVITVDALASRRLSRLGNTVQLTNTGIIPGSGVGNHRSGITEETLGVPVIAIGVPTVVDAATLVTELVEENHSSVRLKNHAQSMIVTPREIDTIVDRAAKLIALSINCALQPTIEPKVLWSLM